VGTVTVEAKAAGTEAVETEAGGIKAVIGEAVGPKANAGMDGKRADIEVPVGMGVKGKEGGA
jgi:hypothetical protein